MCDLCNCLGSTVERPDDPDVDRREYMVAKAGTKTLDDVSVTVVWSN